MTGKTHMVVGATAAVALSGGVPLVSLPLAVICSVIGSLVPDIDHPNSLASTANPFMRLVSFVVRKAFIPAIAVVLNAVSTVIGRTGIKIKDARTGHRLYPFVSKNISFAGIRTGSGAEGLFKAAMTVVLLLLSVNAVYGIIGAGSLL